MFKGILEFFGIFGKDTKATAVNVETIPQIVTSKVKEEATKIETASVAEVKAIKKSVKAASNKIVNDVKKV